MKHSRSKSMAEILAEVEEQKSLDPGPVAAEYPVDGRWVEHDGRVLTVAEQDITAEAALELALSSGLVIWDPCGCGGGCGYEVWQGADVSDLVAAGVPRVKDGTLSRVEDGSGRTGVLVERDVRWGPLR